MHTWHHLSWFLSRRGFIACVKLHDKIKFIENGFHMHSLLCFRCWRFYWFLFLREVKPFIIWFYNPLMDYYDFLYDLVELIVLFKTSPRSSTSEFGCKSYGCFRIGLSASFCKSGNSGLISGLISGPRPVRPPDCPRLAWVHRILRSQSGDSGPGDSWA